MKTIVIAVAAALALVAAAPAAAEDREPSCTFEAPKKMRLGPALKKGIPIEVTCTS